MPFVPLNETRFFVLRNGEYIQATQGNIWEMSSNENCHFLLISCHVIDATGNVRQMSVTERLLLPLERDKRVRLVTNCDHHEQKRGEVFLTNCANEGEFDEIGWQTKRAGKIAYATNGTVLKGHLPVFVWQNEIFPGSYIHKD